MFSVFFQHQATNVLLWGATFNSPNVVPTKALKDLHTIVGDNMIKVVPISPISTIDSWLIGVVALASFGQKKVHLIMLL